MISVCADANILIGALSPDEQNPIHAQFMEDITRRRLLIFSPSHVIAEVTNTLCRKRSLHLIEEEDVNDILNDFFDLPLLLMWDRNLALKTAQFQKDGIKSAYDAAYLALAHTKEIPLITHDKEFYAKAKKMYPATFKLEDWSAS